MAPVVRLTDQHFLKTIANFPDEVRNDATNRVFYLSLAILRHFFGDAWFEKHIGDGGTGGHLRLNWNDPTELEGQSYRILDLAEILFNLQNVIGFDDCIQRMCEGAIEATYAELDLGRLLYQAGVEFEFVKPRGVKGNDYDIEIKFDGQTTVCADAKCKIESTNYSENGVLNSLQYARTQFPKDRPSIIFVKMPSRWIKDQGVGTALINLANKFLRGTGRIVSVKYYFSDIIWSGGIVRHTQTFREINNTHPINRFGCSRNWDMFDAPNPKAVVNSRGEFTDVPERWRRLLYYPEGIPK